MSVRIWLPLLMAIFCFGHAQAQDIRWSTSTSGGFTVDVPAFFTEGTVRALVENGEETGSAYTSEEHDASLRHFTPQRDVRPFALLEQLYPSRGTDVTYRLNRRDLGVLSGFVGGTRAMVFYGICQSGPLRCVTIEYPASEKRLFDPVVTRVVRSLKARTASPRAPNRAEPRAVSRAGPEHAWVILTSMRAAAAGSSEIQTIQTRAQACGLEFFQENSERFLGLQAGLQVFVIGPVVDQPSAERLAARASRCFPDAYATRTRYLGG